MVFLIILVQDLTDRLELSLAILANDALFDQIEASRV